MTEHTHDPETGAVVPPPEDHEHGQDREATEAPEPQDVDAGEDTAEDAPEDVNRREPDGE